MAEAVTIVVEPRDKSKNQGTGSRVSRRLRKQGRIPAIVYGHKIDPVPISLARDDVWQMIKKATHLAQLQIGGQTEMAMVRDVQWDHLGKEIIHLDFFRVSAHERVTTEVKLVLHGTAPGVAEGGILEQPIHALAIACEATSIPDTIRVEIGELHLNGMIHIKDLKLPEGVTATGDPDAVLVHVAPKTAAEATTEPGGPSEPEVIGKAEEKKED